jgi:glycosyltransferase involved in cell wall biosynthesis
MQDVSQSQFDLQSQRPPVLIDTDGADGAANKLHVLFFTSTLGGGGAEKHLLRLANHLDRDKFRVSLALARPSGEFEPAIAGDVQRHYLNSSSKGSSTIRMLRSIRPLRRLIQRERPDVVFSVIDLANIANVLAARGIPSPPKLILGVQTPPSIAYGDSWHPVSNLILRLIPRLYQKADRIVALSKGVAADLIAISSGLRDRVTVIYNAGVEADLLEKAREKLSADELPKTRLVVSCGRLKELKGFAYLIDALAEIRKTVPASLWIIGEGDERAALEERIRRHDLQHAVRLLGFQHNPFKYMAVADVFVLSSLFEGFGNVIVEAMACGVPVVATDCPYGPGEIISDGKNGSLVKPADASALAAAILRVLNDENLSRKLSVAGKDRANDFNAHTIAAEYGELFLEVANRPVAARVREKVAAR